MACVRGADFPAGALQQTLRPRLAAAVSDSEGHNINVEGVPYARPRGARATVQSAVPTHTPTHTNTHHSCRTGTVATCARQPMEPPKPHHVVTLILAA